MFREPDSLPSNCPCALTLASVPARQAAHGATHLMKALQNRIWRGARKVRRDLRHRVLGVPWMDVKPDDRFLFSYPRSGNTWLRHILQHLTFESVPTEYEELEDLLPTIDTLEFQSRMAKMPDGPRFFKSHLPYSPYFLDGKVIYIVRDGRDVMLSYFDYQRKLHGYKGNLESFSKKFMNGWLRYGTWKSNVSTWVAHTNHPNMLLVRFEDLRSDPFSTMRGIAEFSGLTCDETQLRSAIEASSVDKIHATMRSWIFAQGTEFKGGVSADGETNWRGVLSKEQNGLFVDQARELLEALSYPLE